ncbi:MAG: hypothetical protein ACJ8DZ_10040 [Allosphingosinicella sp.]
MTQDTDLLLKSLLAAPQRAPDDAFTLRVQRLVLAEERMRAARRVAWTRFGVETVATASLLAAFWLLSRVAPGGADSAGFIPLSSPAAAGLLLLALWVGVSVRPSGAVSDG